MFFSCLDWSYRDLIENEKIHCDFSLHRIRSTIYHHDLLLMLTWTTLLRQHLSDFSIINMYFFLLPYYSLLWKEVTMQSPCLEGRVLCSTSWGGECRHQSSDSSLWEICLFSLFYSLVQSFIYINLGLWILIYTLCYGPKLCYWFCCSNFLLGHWEIFHLAPVFFCHIPINMGLGFFACLRTFLLSSAPKCSKLVFYISCPSPGSSCIYQDFSSWWSLERIDAKRATGFCTRGGRKLVLTS